MGRYSKYYSNYILRKKHQVTHKGTIFERDWVTIGGQHQIEKGKKPYYSDTNFLFTDNSYPSYKKKHNYGKWVAHWDYDDVKSASDDVNNVKVNISSNDIRDFAYYGSAVELVKSSVTNIIRNFPPTVTLSSDDVYVPNMEGGFDVLEGYHQLNNPFEVDFTHTLSEEEKEKNNLLRFFAESYNDYTVNGKNIKSYKLVNRYFIEKTESGKRTVKERVTDFKIEKIENINKEIIPLSIRKNDIELIESNTLSISDFGYNNIPMLDKVSIQRYDKNNGEIRVDNVEYECADGVNSPLRKAQHTCNVVQHLEGYGFTVNGYGTVLYNGTDIDVTLNNGRQALKNVVLQKGYTYEVNGINFTPVTRQIVTPVYFSNDGERHLLMTVDGNELDFDISIILRDYSTESITTNASFNIIGSKIIEPTEEGEEPTILTDTITFSNINVNNSKRINSKKQIPTFLTFSNEDKLIISNGSNSEYVDNSLTATITNKPIYYLQSTKRIVTGNGVLISNISSTQLSNSDFQLSFVRKSQANVTSTFTIHPAENVMLENGFYFIEVDGNREKFNWKETCYKESDNNNYRINVNSVNRVRYYRNEIQFIQSNNQILELLEEINVEGFILNHICLYIERVSYPSYLYMQCVTEEQLPDFLEDGWNLMDCQPSTWLPTLDMDNGLDKYVKDCDECIDENCYVTFLISHLSNIMEDGDYKNMPLYTVYITDKEDTEYKLEAYLSSGEIIFITKDEKFVLKCKKENFVEFFNGLDGFEKQLLTLNSKPLYKNSFLTPFEGELVYKYVYRDYIWPSTFDSELGYGLIDITSDTYIGYLSKLIDMATVFDELWTDNLYRNMTHESIKNFDWTYTREYNEGEEQDNIDGGNQIMKLLRIYGRAFDDIKKLADGIGYVTKNTYDGYVNQPDAEISDRLEIMGWDITSTIPNFPDTEQGYIGKDTGYIINKTTYDSLESSEKTYYEPAFINHDTAQIIGEAAYNGLEDVVKKKFSKYFPAMDLSDVAIDVSFTDLFDKKDCSTHAKWFNSTNSDNVDTSKTDIDFMKKLLLSSNRIFNTKGTKHSIDMVMGLFGFGDDDYELIESYYTTTPKEYTDELYEDIENINYYKDYPKNYDDIYSGIPLKDIFIGNKPYIVPFYNQKRTYDGDFIFESRGGWANKDNGYYTETLSYLHVVGDFSSLLDINPNSLNDGDIYYVVSIANYTDYVNTLPENLSHFFYLKDNGKYNPQLPESWENVNMEALDDEHTKKAKYLDSIISTNIGNNPHVGYGTYDSGDEFKQYMEKPFKFSIDEYLLDDEELKTKAENITYTLSDGEDSDKVKVLTEDDGSKYYINRKLFIMKNKLDGDLFKKYFMDVIVKYVMQVIPSTSILVLENFEYTTSEN